MLIGVKDHLQEFLVNVSGHSFETASNQILVDVHGHWLPYVDDGVKSTDEALQVIRGLVKMGYQKLIATPHINNQFPDNNPEKLVYSFYQIAQEASRSRIDVKLGIAAEYMLDSGFDKHLAARNLLTLDDKTVLIEFPTFQTPPNIEEVLFELQICGYKPLLAHPERYSFFHSDLSRYEKLKELGCLFQLNLLSFAPNQNDHIRNAASKLLNCDWYEYIGTDIHSPEQLKYLTKIRLRHTFSNNELL